MKYFDGILKILKAGDAVPPKYRETWPCCQMTCTVLHVKLLDLQALRNDTDDLSGSYILACSVILLMQKTFGFWPFMRFVIQTQLYLFFFQKRTESLKGPKRESQFLGKAELSTELHIKRNEITHQAKKTNNELFLSSSQLLDAFLRQSSETLPSRQKSGNQNKQLQTFLFFSTCLNIFMLAES